MALSWLPEPIRFGKPRAKGSLNSRNGIDRAGGISLAALVRNAGSVRYIRYFDLKSLVASIVRRSQWDTRSASSDQGKNSWAFFPAAQIVSAILEWLTCQSLPVSTLTFPNVAMNATLTRPLFERIHDALTTNPHVPSHLVMVEAEEGRIVLKGSVKSFFQKQMAQEAVRRVDGVEQIDNLLQVNWT